LNLTELNHLIYAGTLVITEEIRGTGSYKSETQSPKTPPPPPPPCVRRMQESINCIRKEPWSSAEIKGNELKTKEYQNE
jgi:hypothetical protein